MTTETDEPLCPPELPVLGPLSHDLLKETPDVKVRKSGFKLWRGCSLAASQSCKPSIPIFSSVMGQNATYFTEMVTRTTKILFMLVAKTRAVHGRYPIWKSFVKIIKMNLYKTNVCLINSVKQIILTLYHVFKLWRSWLLKEILSLKETSKHAN